MLYNYVDPILGFSRFEVLYMLENGLQDQYRVLGENVAKLKMDLMKEQLATFRSQLEDFARKHKVH